MTSTRLPLSDLLMDQTHLSVRKKKELELCSIMLTDDELNEISSIRAGYVIARARLVEGIKEHEPWLYAKLKKTKRVPIFGISEIAREFVSNTED